MPSCWSCGTSRRRQEHGHLDIKGCTAWGVVRGDRILVSALWGTLTWPQTWQLQHHLSNNASHLSLLQSTGLKPSEVCSLHQPPLVKLAWPLRARLTRHYLPLAVTYNQIPFARVCESVGVGGLKAGLCHPRKPTAGHWPQIKQCVKATPRHHMSSWEPPTAWPDCLHS